jgi:hypothetical protein
MKKICILILCAIFLSFPLYTGPVGPMSSVPVGETLSVGKAIFYGIILLFMGWLLWKSPDISAPKPTDAKGLFSSQMADE